MINKKVKVIGVTSGKGGVGKTAVATNLATALVGLGHKVMYFDADMGLANAQLAFGCRPEWTFADVLAGRKTLAQIIVTTRQGVRLIPGASGIQKLASLGELETSGIVGAFGTIEEDIDYLIVDTAAGIADSVVTFMHATPIRFVVIRDDPSSIADAYGVIKVLHTGHRLDNFFLVPNMVKSETAGQELHRKVNAVCNRFLNLQVGYLCSITLDQHMEEASRAYKPVIEFAPGGNAARDFRRLASLTGKLSGTASVSGYLQFFVEQLVKRAGSEADA